jgi:hypothetical protein
MFNFKHSDRLLGSPYPDIVPVDLLDTRKVALSITIIVLDKPSSISIITGTSIQNASRLAYLSTEICTCITASLFLDLLSPWTTITAAFDWL